MAFAAGNGVCLEQPAFNVSLSALQQNNNYMCNFRSSVKRNWKQCEVTCSEQIYNCKRRCFEDGPISSYGTSFIPADDSEMMTYDHQSSRLRNNNWMDMDVGDTPSPLATSNVTTYPSGPAAMQTKPQRVCGRCKAGESGHINHII